ncbi:regulatory iron-sulfur-containing complex subunit RicT [Planctomycetota bacterium]
MPENTDNRQQQRPRNKRYMLVRYGRMHHISLFEHNENEMPRVPTKVVVKTDKGLELGGVVGHLTCYKGGRFKLDPEQIDEYFKISEVDISCRRAGKFIRFASDDDLRDQQHMKKDMREESAICRRFAEELKLPMKIVDAEHILGGERIIFYFMAEGRIDFRELVRKLSHEFQTRIEMRQIGARDEAKILGDVESCGQEICCRRFLKYLKPVNMRMAKMQKATLDPAKISGYCGRLKCCLRYEDSTYAELKKRLPNKSAYVSTPEGNGRVIYTQILTQLVVVDIEGGDRTAVAVDDIRVIPGGPPRKPSPDEAPAPSKPEGRDRRNGKPVSAVKEKAEAPEKSEEKSENKARGDQRRRRRGNNGPGRKRRDNRGPREARSQDGKPPADTSTKPDTPQNPSGGKKPEQSPPPAPENHDT